MCFLADNNGSQFRNVNWNFYCFDLLRANE